MIMREGNPLYMVQIATGDSVDARIMTAREIFLIMNMADCYPDGLEIDVFRLNGIGEIPDECEFIGKGSCPGDPQKMEIMCKGDVVEIGYGTEH